MALAGGRVGREAVGVDRERAPDRGPACELHARVRTRARLRPRARVRAKDITGGWPRAASPVPAAYVGCGAPPVAPNGRPAAPSVAPRLFHEEDRASDEGEGEGDVGQEGPRARAARPDAAQCWRRSFPQHLRLCLGCQLW